MLRGATTFALGIWADEGLGNNTQFKNKQGITIKEITLNKILFLFFLLKIRKSISLTITPCDTSQHQ